MIGLRHLVVRCGVVLALASTMLFPSTVRAQSIVNVAQIEWDAGTVRQVRPSNRVTIARAQPPVSALTLLRVSRDPGARDLLVGPALCAGTQPPQTSAPGPASVAPAQAILPSEGLVLAFESPADNRDAATVETVGLVLTGADGDRETVTLTETGPNTGTFTGLIRTVPTPPAAIRDDCRLSVSPGQRLAIAITRADNGADVAAPALDILIDPFGITFDSADGAPVAGTRVTLIDDATGRSAQVFGDDGVSAFPSSVVTGSTVTDSGGTTYVFPPGDYRFPLARPGRYRLKVEPPAPYRAPSTATPAELAGFSRPEGGRYTIVAGSYGQPFTLSDPAPVRIDIPLDKPGAPIALSKTASAVVAEPGDVIQYRITVGNTDAVRSTGAVTVTDTIPEAMRLRADTVRFNGNAAPHMVTSDGRTLSVPIGPLAGGASGLVTYLLEVRPDARPGEALNRAQAFDTRGAESIIAAASVRIARDSLADRMTIIGRVTEGGCTVDPRQSKGIAGVRVLMEDGSYAVTDIEGRYHFDGVLPGLHVVQIEPATLPLDRAPIDCSASAEAAGSAISRFVTGSGGMVKRADFRATAVAPRADAARQAVRAAIASDAEAAGAAADWFAAPGTDIAWLFPAPEHNPRTRAVRVAIRHLPGQKVALFADGKPVDGLSFEGATPAPDGTRAVSLWRGVELTGRTARFSAQVRDAGGTLIQTLTRDVHFAASPMTATLVRERSVLVADGVTRPVIAVRLTNRDGKPVHHGLVGDFAVPAPYYPAVEADAQAARQLSGLERARPVWRVQGDDGIALIELEPTTASGTLAISFAFRDGEAQRTQRIETWLDPGDRPWTIVGFAAGTAGFSTLANRSETLGKGGETWFTDARLALYAKGRVQGKWLMTLAYDSDKDEDETRFQGTIDPSAYYTVYADRSERRFDAASLRRLYLRLERPQFYALFGDYETGFDEAELARYVRSFNGAKAEFNNGRVKATAFAADTPFRHRREELQGNGLSGPYALAARDILPNSEVVVIEVRDRLRSDRIIERTTLTRYVDYDIDYVGGLISFKSPVLSRSSSLDPQFIVVDYEVDGVGERVVNAGARAAWRSADGKLQLAATAIRDETDTDTTLLGGADIRYQPSAATEIRAEIAVTDRNARAGSLVAPDNVSGTSTAWLVEAEHHGSTIDLLAYARQQDGGFGVGQTNVGETGTRKVGADIRARLTETLSVSARAWQEDYLLSDARRRAGEALIEYRTKNTDLRAGVILADDRLADGREASSTLAQLGATQRLFGNRLELDAQTEFALTNSNAPDANDSVDFPARHRLSARFAVTPGIGLVGAYEIAEGEAVTARTARVGFDIKPWTGARLVTTANRQDIAEYGPRTFAAYGLAQSLPLGKNWTVDLSVDGNKTLGGIDPARVLNLAHPVASGGHLGSDGSITEDFTALTAGATYRADRWSWTGRAELRHGDSGDRWGITTAALRQIGEGSAVGAQASVFHADSPTGTTTESARIAVSWAHRPATSSFAFLNKLEFKSDSITGAVIGAPGPIGGAPALIDGDALSRRAINSLSLNYAPGNGEYALFWGTRYVFDRFAADEIEGWSNIVGADLRFDLTDTIAVGAQGTVRQGAGARSMAWSAGPSITVSPMKNSAITIGYNAIGFHDRDFEDARYTRSGPFVTLKLKFDQTSLASLGLGRR